MKCKRFIKSVRKRTWLYKMINQACQNPVLQLFTYFCKGHNEGAVTLHNTKDSNHATSKNNRQTPATGASESIGSIHKLYNLLDNSEEGLLSTIISATELVDHPTKLPSSFVHRIYWILGAGCFLKRIHQYCLQIQLQDTAAVTCAFSRIVTAICQTSCSQSV